MAFKKMSNTVDDQRQTTDNEEKLFYFSKLDVRKQEPEDPYRRDDTDFVGKDLRTGYLVLGLDQRHTYDGDRIVMGRALRGTDIDLGQTPAPDTSAAFVGIVFAGRRKEDFDNGLGRHISDTWSAGVERGNFDQESYQFTIKADGYWKPKNWKTADGEWRKSFYFHVARWSYRTAPDGPVIIEGRLPEGSRLAEDEKEAATKAPPTIDETRRLDRAAALVGKERERMSAASTASDATRLTRKAPADSRELD